ncbi:asparagine synthase-domain-containing protein [Crucibulum laeve]|uniref:Asparagine synthase-domain-containing protein n=1 Tax=Crucibulum laeve TaxID=68775 RepID=A0A5C3M948_9AGAR|nr:asparagine synthase-domain-containing protein [Crucibulum laeve]
MCGIFFSCWFTDTIQPSQHETINHLPALCERLRSANSARGPDAQNSYRTHITSNSSDHRLELDFYASELRLRGDFPIVQPHVKNENILCWNGEIFEGMKILPQENDGVKLSNALSTVETAEDVRHVFGNVEGPYAFVFYHVASRCLYFGRDPLGRRSLLLHKPTDQLPYLLLCSVSAGSDQGHAFDEIPTDSIFCLNLDAFVKEQGSIAVGYQHQLARISRANPDIGVLHSLPYASPSRINEELPPDDLYRVESLENIPDYLRLPVEELVFQLDRSVKLRVSDIPRNGASSEARVAILFSGGIDSTILTFLAHKHIPMDEPIDLLNVAFENPRKIQIQKEGHIDNLPKRQKRQRARISENVSQEFDTSYMVPDRVTGLQELEELKRLCPGRVWNFVEVNIPYEESQAAHEAVEALMLPGRTVMDLASNFCFDTNRELNYIVHQSLALALYFASRGVGQVRTSPRADPKPYTSPARVLLNGLGSDELLGGYGRHRTVFNLSGWRGVINEAMNLFSEQLQLEIDRIPMRNLGRDDRVVSSHGKEMRHPFLSLSVVSFLASLPVHYKMDPRLEVGLGDKMLLRLATRDIGLVEASGRKKRAMQFGSHSARMNGERRGDVELNS